MLSAKIMSRKTTEADDSTFAGRITLVFYLLLEQNRR
jgi:hypothetical protein